MDRIGTSLVLGGLAAAVALAAPAAAAALRLKPCRDQPGFGCGTLTVPLDRSGRYPGTVDLEVAVQTGGGDRRRRLLVALSGGPGQGGVEAARAFAFTLAPALGRYRLAVIDQRGTRSSGVLDCPTLQRIRAPAAMTAERIAECADLIGPRRAFYATSDSVGDLDALRAALHQERMALMGVSYGTFVAQQYARAHPERVDRLILDSVVPPGGVHAFQLDSFRALGRVVREQCANGACDGITPDPVADIAALAARLDGGTPISGRAFGATGRARTASYRTSDELFDLVVAGDLNQYLQPALPAAIRAAVRGDHAPLLRLKRIGLGGPLRPSELSFAVNVITVCEDTRLPYALSAPFERRLELTRQADAGLPATELAPFGVETVRRLSTAQSCLLFPPDLVTAPSTARLPDVPALLLGGRLDIRTALEGAREVAAELPRAQVVAVPGTGHDELDNDVSGCTQLALRRFIVGRAVGKPCAGVQNALNIVPLPPRSLRDYRPAPGVAGARGRIVSAVVDTVYDATLSALQTVFAGYREIRGGGLRGGRFRGDDDGLMWLSRYALVTGLRISGRYDSAADSPTGRLRVDGPGGLDGVLRLESDGEITGRLGGRPVRAPATFTIIARAAGGHGPARWRPAPRQYPHVQWRRRDARGAIPRP